MALWEWPNCEGPLRKTDSGYGAAAAAAIAATRKAGLPSFSKQATTNWH